MVAHMKKQANREKLLQQGVTLLMEQGYHGTGIKEILDKVKIPKGSFYHYFSSKEQFGAEAIDFYIEPFILQLDEYLNEPELDALSSLQNYYLGLINELEEKNFKGGCLLGNLMGEIGETSEICRLALKDAVSRYRMKQQAVIYKAQQQGTVRTDLTVELMADLLVNAWQGALLRMKIEKSTQPLNEFYRLFLEDYLKDKPLL